MRGQPPQAKHKEESMGFTKVGLLTKGRHAPLKGAISVGLSTSSKRGGRKYPFLQITISEELLRGAGISENRIGVLVGQGSDYGAIRFVADPEGRKPYHTGRGYRVRLSLPMDAGYLFHKTERYSAVVMQGAIEFRPAQWVLSALRTIQAGQEMGGSDGDE